MFPCRLTDKTPASEAGYRGSNPCKGANLFLSLVVPTAGMSEQAVNLSSRGFNFRLPTHQAG